MSGTQIDETTWNSDPKAYLGPNYQKIVALIDVFSQYDSRELYKILNNVRDFNFDQAAQTKMLESDPAKRILQQTIGESFLEALKNLNDKVYSAGLDAELIPPLDERLFPKAKMLAGKIGMEVYEGKIGVGSLTSKILFQPCSRKPLTLEGLQPLPSSWALTKTPITK